MMNIRSESFYNNFIRINCHKYLLHHEYSMDYVSFSIMEALRESKLLCRLAFTLVSKIPRYNSVKDLDGDYLACRARILPKILTILPPEIPYYFIP